MLPSDLREYGKSPAPMPAPLAAVCKVLIAIAVIGTAYGLVADEADRVVVMSRVEFDKTVAQERIKAAQEVMDAVGTCTWRDQFSETPRVRRAM